tara:strand:- start:214 stop:552 length:339 start_codon:yes stop_codon:yes gene_type:complete
MITDELLKWKTDEILERLRGEDVPCAPILDRWSLLDDPQVEENKMIETHSHPILGNVRQPRPAARFDRSPASVEKLAPFLGQDNDVILQEAGYSKEEIADFYQRGVLGLQEL